MYIVKRSSLPAVRSGEQILARIFEGAENGGVGVSAFLVDAPAGTGPALHRHPYEEVFVLMDGKALFEAGEEEFEATPEDVLVLPSGLAHKFTALGPGPARMVNIHVHRTVVTEWL